MTYEEIVGKIRKTFEEADARRIHEHIAFEIAITGEVSGTMYFELANRACVIEPYNYQNNDGIITASAKVLLQLASTELHLKDALEQGLVRFEGNEEKMRTCLENIRLPGVKYPY